MGSRKYRLQTAPTNPSPKIAIASPPGLRFSKRPRRSAVEQPEGYAVGSQLTVKLLQRTADLPLPSRLLCRRIAVAKRDELHQFTHSSGWGHAEMTVGWKRNRGWPGERLAGRTIPCGMVGRKGMRDTNLRAEYERIGPEMELAMTLAEGRERCAILLRWPNA
jgi:hypothetical protein